MRAGEPWGMTAHRLAGRVVPAGVAAVAVVAFLPALRNRFVSWDDLALRRLERRARDPGA